MTLDQYRINWVYRKGSSNAVADALSHRYASAEESELAQSKLIQCDAIVCRTQAGALFRLCFANWKLDEIVTRSKTRQKQIEIVPQVPLRMSADDVQKQNLNLSPLELPKSIPREKVTEKDVHKHQPDIPKGIVMRKDVHEHQLDTWVSPKNSEIQKSQERDDELSPIIELLKNSPKHVLEEKLLGYYLDEGVLYFSDGTERGKLVVPKEHRQLVCCEHHSLPTGGHFGSKKTLAAIRTKYFWPFMV
ncbi:MAG: hypothetical protein GY820_18450, partial [Gammaproteobacteria bacterium]|nr:hypothetical protein [Gammaproteobacteria bacterium]